MTYYTFIALICWDKVTFSSFLFDDNNPGEGVNEIKEYVDACYVSAPESMWRIFQNKMHDHSHAII